MRRYVVDDVIPFYFIISSNRKNDNKAIAAWTDDKQLAKFYMDFHNCKYLRLKVISDKPVSYIGGIIDECIHDEIGIYNIKVRSGNRREEMKTISIPATESEMMFVNADSQSYFASYVDYGYLNKVIPYLKDKWQGVLEDVLLNDVIKSVIHNKQSKYLQHIELDQLALLCKSFIDNFGR